MGVAGSIIRATKMTRAILVRLDAGWPCARQRGSYERWTIH
jgi:hypothetical protein